MHEFNQDVKSRLAITADLIQSARYSLMDSYHMIHTPTSELFVLVNRDKFLSRTRVQLWRISVIELCKVFSRSRNEDFRISKLLRDVVTRYDDINWKNHIKSDVDAFSEILDSSSISSIVDDLIELRNQHYAHSDKSPNKHHHEIKLYYEQMLTLILLAEQIVDKLNFGILDIEPSSSRYEGNNVRCLLKNIIEDREELGSYRIKVR